MKKIAISLITTAVVLGMGTVNANQIINEKNKTTKNLNSSVKNDYEFVIEGTGNLTNISGNRYQLIMPLNSIKNGVLAYSKNPRTAVNLTLAQFEKVAHTGSNSFDKVPPNLAVTIHSSGKTLVSAAFELTSLKKDPVTGTLTWNLQLLVGKDKETGQLIAKPKNASGNVSLLVDGAEIDIFRNAGVD